MLLWRWRTTSHIGLLMLEQFMYLSYYSKKWVIISKLTGTCRRRLLMNRDIAELALQLLLSLVNLVLAALIIFHLLSPGRYTFVICPLRRSLSDCRGILGGLSFLYQGLGLRKSGSRLLLLILGKANQVLRILLVRPSTLALVRGGCLYFLF